MIVHPAAELFPMLSKTQLRELQHDMEIHGMREPIKRWNGMVIDGRNRMEAIKGTAVKAIFQEMEFADESDVISYIISTNIQRRHLTTSQRAMIADELAKLEKGVRADRVDAQICASTTSQAQAAKSLDVSRRAVQQARAVSKADPVLAQKVKAGEVTLNAAHKQIAPPKPKPTPPPAPNPVIPDPDFAHTDDPPPLIPPAKPKRLIGPAEGEDEDEWKDTQSEPEANWYEPTDEARAALAAVLALDDESRQWVIEQL